MKDSSSGFPWQNLRDQGVLSLSAALDDPTVIDWTERYGAHNYQPLPVNVVHAEGSRVYDGSGKEFIDCIGAFSALAHGHLNKFIVETAREQLTKLSLVSRAAYSTELALFMRGLCDYAGVECVLPMNTGVEAVETCLKVARKWSYEVKGVPADQAEIIVAENNFHGRTVTVVSFSSDPQYQHGFGPLTPGFRGVPFGDTAAIEAAITPRTAAILLEPIQAEGGIMVPPPGYMAAVRKLCTAHRIALIWDEVQTGFCRTGEKFAWQYEDAAPDLMSVGKPLGGGLFPVSAAIGRKEFFDVIHPGDHGSTFGGNPLGCAIALAAMAVMEVEGYAEMSRTKGERLVAALAAKEQPAIIDIRGRGLLIGIEVAADVDSKRVQAELLKQGLLTKETRNRTFRLTPPLTIEDELVDQVAERFHRAVAIAVG